VLCLLCAVLRCCTVPDDIDWNVCGHGHCHHCRHSTRADGYLDRLAVLLQAVGSRSNVQCLEKWYSQLSPSMVARGEWGSGDDRRLLRSLFLRYGAVARDSDREWGWGLWLVQSGAAPCWRSCRPVA
jgi:hypothetical protein